MKGTLIEIIHGKYSKFEIYRRSRLQYGIEFPIYKDGRYFASHGTLSAAVRAATTA